MYVNFALAPDQTDTYFSHNSIYFFVERSENHLSWTFIELENGNSFPRETERYLASDFRRQLSNFHGKWTTINTSELTSTTKRSHGDALREHARNPDISPEYYQEAIAAHVHRSRIVTHNFFPSAVL